MSEAFERVDSNFTTNVSWNRVPVPEDFYAIRLWRRATIR